jgi:hypothetical protein
MKYTLPIAASSVAAWGLVAATRLAITEGEDTTYRKEWSICGCWRTWPGNTTSNDICSHIIFSNHSMIKISKTYHLAQKVRDWHPLNRENKSHLQSLPSYIKE